MKTLSWVQVVQPINRFTVTPPPHPLYCIHYQLAPPLMSQTGVIDLSVINKNLSIRFRSKFRKQSEGSISNYLRAIPFARACFQLSNSNTRMIAWVIAKTVKGEGLIYSEEFFILTTLIIFFSKHWSSEWSENVVCVIILIRVVITRGAVVWSVRQKLSVITSDGLPSSQVWAGSDAACNWVNQLEDANQRWATWKISTHGGRQTIKQTIMMRFRKILLFALPVFCTASKFQSVMVACETVLAWICLREPAKIGCQPSRLLIK